jgi:hypothetical protein
MRLGNRSRICSLGVTHPHLGAFRVDAFEVLDGRPVDAVAFGDDRADGAETEAHLLGDLPQGMAGLVEFEHLLLLCLAGSERSTDIAAVTELGVEQRNMCRAILEGSANGLGRQAVGRLRREQPGELGCSGSGMDRKPLTLQDFFVWSNLRAKRGAAAIKRDLVLDATKFLGRK